MPTPTLLSTLQFLLNQFKDLRLNDGFMVSLHIILRNFAFVDLFLLCKKVDRVAFLQERIAFILFVGQDAPNCSGIPLVFAAWRLDTVTG